MNNLFPFSSDKSFSAESMPCVSVCSFLCMNADMQLICSFLSRRDCISCWSATFYYSYVI